MNDAFELLVIMLAVSSPIWMIVLVVHYFKYRSEVARRTVAVENEAAETHRALEADLAALQERVQVLEAIVTDSRYDLGRKIASL